MNAIKMIRRSAKRQIEDARWPSNQDLAPVQDIPAEATVPPEQDHLPDPPVIEEPPLTHTEKTR